MASSRPQSNYFESIDFGVALFFGIVLEERREILALEEMMSKEYIYLPEKRMEDFKECAEILSREYRVIQEWVDHIPVELIKPVGMAMPLKGERTYFREAEMIDFMACGMSGLFSMARKI